MAFMWTGVVLPLLRTHFYVTETEGTRNRVVFYRKTDWHHLTTTVLPALVQPAEAACPSARRAAAAPAGRGANTSISGAPAIPAAAAAADAPAGCQAAASRRTRGPSAAASLDCGRATDPRVFRKISQGEAKEVMGRRSFGAAKLRLLPKPGVRKVRPIVNMGRRYPVASTRPGNRGAVYSVNAALAKPFAVLTAIKRAQPEILGASVASLGIDLLVRYLPLARLWQALRREHAGAGGTPVMYMASLDVVKSFDSIRHDKLMQVVDTLLSHDEYRLRKCAVAQMLPARCCRRQEPAPRASASASTLAEEDGHARLSGGQQGAGVAGPLLSSERPGCSARDKRTGSGAGQCALSALASASCRGGARGGALGAGARGSGVRFETRSTPVAGFSQFAKEAHRMALEVPCHPRYIDTCMHAYKDAYTYVAWRRGSRLPACLPACLDAALFDLVSPGCAHVLLVFVSGQAAQAPPSPSPSRASPSPHGRSRLARPPARVLPYTLQHTFAPIRKGRTPATYRCVLHKCIHVTQRADAGASSPTWSSLKRSLARLSARYRTGT